jgi:exodeoxyribonuclease VII large subunit
MLTAGVGTLLVQLEEQKRKLAAEGLFDPGRKQPVPAYPECVVLVTSPTGAAYHDMIRVLTRRWPCARVELVETAVQGSSAPTEIVAALQAADRLQPDVILLGRGGGSMEDLWAFNSEAVVRAIVAVSVPLVSGIGHETDFTLADFAADLRAPTPSAAAEISTPDQREVRQSLDRKSRQLADILHHHLQSGHAAIRELDGCLRGLSPGANLQSARQRLHYLSQQILDAVLNSLLLRSRDMLVLDKALSSLGPETTLARGYAIVTRVETDEIVDRTCSLSVGEALNVCVGEGRFTAKVASIQSSR